AEVTRTAAAVHPSREVERAGIASHGEVDRPVGGAVAQHWRVALRDAEAAVGTVAAVQLDGDPAFVAAAIPVVVRVGSPGAFDGGRSGLNRSGQAEGKQKVLHAR